jgi:DNA-binding CsgD family transcriptional regulator
MLTAEEGTMGERPNTELPVPGLDGRSRNRTDVGPGGRSPGRGADRELSRAIRQLELPIALIELDNFSVLAVSNAALKLLGMPASAIVGRPVIDLIGSEERADALAVHEAIRAGHINFYRASRRLGATEESRSLSTVWVRAIQFGERRVTLVELVDGNRPRESPLVEHLGREPLHLVVGAMDAGWVVTSVSDNITSVLGIHADELVGRPLVSADEQRALAKFFDADRRGHAESSVSLRIRLKDAAGAFKPLRCMLTSLAGTTDRLFILIADSELPDTDAVTRASQLEQHLWRIAAEIEASGILQQIGDIPDMARFPQMEALTVRQWEVLGRLMRGERVSQIAAALFVSDSTVRNHLSAIFERFGVHSQAELLALLGRTDGSSS